MAETPEVQPHPTPAAPSVLNNTIHVLTVELVALPFCFNGADGWKQNNMGEMLSGFGIGLTIALLGLTFPSWRHKLSAEVIAKWAPVAAVLAFTYFLGPSIYQRAVLWPTPPAPAPVPAPFPPPAPSATTQPDPRDATIASLQAQLNTAKQQAEAAKRALLEAQKKLTVAPQKQPLSREELQQINTKIGILQNVRDDYLKKFGSIYDMWAMWKTNWNIAIKTTRPGSLDLLSRLKASLQDASQRLEDLRVEYPGYHDISDILAQPQTGRVLKALDDLSATVATLPNPPPPDYDQRLLPYFGALTAEFDTMKDWIGKTQAAINGKIKELAELRQQ
jgi:hypothetical protein